MSLRSVSSLGFKKQRLYTQHSLKAKEEISLESSFSNSISDLASETSNSASRAHSNSSASEAWGPKWAEGPAVPIYQ